jgi:hypothetical protein
MFIRKYRGEFMKYSNVFLFVVLLVVAGCSTTPVKFSDSKPVPNKRVYDAFAKYSTPSKSGSKVVIVRDSGAMGSAGSASLFVNGELVSHLDTSESIVIHVDLGDNLFGLAPGAKLSFEPDNVELIEQALLVTPNKTYYYRITIDANKGLILQRSSQI